MFGAAVLHAIQIHDFRDQLVEIEAREVHVGGARILAECIDHLLHRIDLRHDGGGRALEDLSVLLVHAAEEFAAHPLGGQLDRRQRVLDLVRQTARHLAPGRIALRLQQRGDVIEHQHHARGAAGVVWQRRAGAHQARACRTRTATQFVRANQDAPAAGAA